jgi:hypothetical protein
VDGVLVTGVLPEFRANRYGSLQSRVLLNRLQRAALNSGAACNSSLVMLIRRMA